MRNFLLGMVVGALGMIAVVALDRSMRLAGEERSKRGFDNRCNQHSPSSTGCKVACEWKVAHGDR